MNEFYLIKLPISEATADIAGMPAEFFATAIRKVGKPVLEPAPSEFERMRNLVQPAYHEGFQAGMSSALGDHETWALTWLRSRTRMTLLVIDSGEADASDIPEPRE